MSRRNEGVDLILAELERHELSGEVSHRGGGHLEIAWNAPQGRRFLIVANTPSDWRASLNNRSDLRKLLRADGLQPTVISALSFQKAMSLPKQPTINRESVLQNDIEALTDLVIEMQAEMQAEMVELKQQNQLLHDKMNSVTVVSKIEFAGQDKPEDADVTLQVSRKLFEEVKQPREKKQTKVSLVLEALTEQFSHVGYLPKQMGITRGHLNSILQKARRDGLVENGLRGMWRKKS
jgi:hypothetical protein